ncbi:MAG: haloacid dehalogenase type II [Chloroflexi bacterium]|nr:haloacid dehalogenase type II [Chloroflexota bacterium]
MPDVTAVVFDLYGTLLDVTSLVERCERIVPHVSARDLVELWRRKQLEYTWLRSVMGRYVDFWAVTTEALEHAAGRLGARLDAPAQSRLMEGWLLLEPYPEVRMALDRLDRLVPSIPLAVLSNGSPQMLEQVLEHTRLRSRFRHVLSVDEVRIYKPSPRVYALAERHLGLARSSILFVSANGWDVAGAGAFGFSVAWVNRSGVPAEALPGAPALVVDDLEALADALEQQRSPPG